MDAAEGVCPYRPFLSVWHLDVVGSCRILLSSIAVEHVFRTSLPDTDSEHRYRESSALIDYRHRLCRLHDEPEGGRAWLAKNMFKTALRLTTKREGHANEGGKVILGAAVFD